MAYTRRRVLACGLFFLASATGASSAAEPLQLSFGVYTTDKPTEMFRAFKPILVALEDALAVELGKPVQVKLRVFNSYDAARESLLKEEIDFVRFGPSSYILAKDKNPKIRILVIEENEGQHLAKGVIFTRTDSGIDSIKDLRGRSFAFGDPDSTIGRYLSQSFLVDEGIYAKDLSKFEYLDRHDKVVDSVLFKSFDAGVAKEGTYAKFRDKGLKVLQTFDNITKPWVARSQLDARVGDAIQKCLVAIKDKKVLDAIGEKITGFNVEYARDTMYDQVREGMRKSEAFLGSVKVDPAAPPRPEPAN